MRWLTTFICCGWGYGSIIMPLLPHLLTKIWDISWKPDWPGHSKWSPCALVEVPNPQRMVPISNPYIYKVIDNLHMLWMGMGIWIHHHAITLVDQDFWSSLFAGAQQMKHVGICWGSKLTWNGSHIHSIHIQGVWQHFVDPNFGILIKSWVTASWKRNNTIQLYLRLNTDPEWMMHSYQTYAKCLTTIICIVNGQMDPSSPHYHSNCWPPAVHNIYYGEGLCTRSLWTPNRRAKYCNSIAHCDSRREYR